MKIVFHGNNAATFAPGFPEMLSGNHQIILVPDAADAPEEQDALMTADVVIGVHYGADDPPISARLYQLPSAGYDKIDMGALPADCAVCNCFGHEDAIAEYVMAALLSRHVPLADADARLRQGDWHYWAGGPDGLRTELGAQSIGIVGHGHIGKTVALRALAFGMQVHVANRSPVTDDRYAGTWSLTQLPEMCAGVDIVLNTLPLTDETTGLIGQEALSAMRPDAIVMNVGRGPVIDEAALFDALSAKRIGGAILDTWYVYPNAGDRTPMPATLPFQDLDNVMMTPHMSGWTTGTIARRQATMAENISRLEQGKPLLNCIRAARGETS